MQIFFIFLNKHPGTVRLNTLSEFQFVFCPDFICSLYSICLAVLHKQIVREEHIDGRDQRSPVSAHSAAYK